MIKREDIYIRDPFVYVEDDTLYLVGTTDETAWGGPANGFKGYKTKDLKNFEGPFELFKRTEDFWADHHFWAPELHKVNGKYLLVASFKSNDRCRGSQILVSDTVFGKYVPLEKPFTNENWECLDATLYKENNKLYTIFSHEWLQVHDGEMCVGELSDDMCSIIGEPKVLFKASEAKWVISNTETGIDFVTDAPFIHKLKNGKLLMTWSSHSSLGYAVGMAVSENGIMGPWKHIDEPLFKKDGGHGMIFEFNNKLYISLHAPNFPSLSERPHFFEVVENDDILILKDELI